MGSKRKLAKHILPIILKDRKPGQWYVEPFVGGANMIDKVSGNRLGADVNHYLIEALKLIRDNPASIPHIITEDDYKNARNGGISDGLLGFIGFSMSFGGKWFGGYRRDVAGTKGSIENMKIQTRRVRDSAIKQSVNIQNVKLIRCSFEGLDIPRNSIIYCDPPYQDTTKYKDGFNHMVFWGWVRMQSTLGHKVFVSEYQAPDDFECVWSMDVTNHLTKTGDKRRRTEKLFTCKLER